MKSACDARDRQSACDGNDDLSTTRPDSSAAADANVDATPTCQFNKATLPFNLPPAPGQPGHDPHRWSEMDEEDRANTDAELNENDGKGFPEGSEASIDEGGDANMREAPALETGESEDTANTKSAPNNTSNGANNASSCEVDMPDALGDLLFSNKQISGHRNQNDVCAKSKARASTVDTHQHKGGKSKKTEVAVCPECVAVGLRGFHHGACDPTVRAKNAASKKANAAMQDQAKRARAETETGQGNTERVAKKKKVACGSCGKWSHPTEACQAKECGRCGGRHMGLCNKPLPGAHWSGPSSSTSPQDEVNNLLNTLATTSSPVAQDAIRQHLEARLKAISNIGPSSRAATDGRTGGSSGGQNKDAESRQSRVQTLSIRSRSNGTPSSPDRSGERTDSEKSRDKRRKDRG